MKPINAYGTGCWVEAARPLRRSEQTLEHSRPGTRRGLLQPLGEGPVAPLLPRDFVRFREVAAENLVHLLREFGSQHHDVNLVVVEKAAPVEIARSHGGPHAIDGGGLRVEHAVLALEDLHAGIEQGSIEGTSRLAREPAVAAARKHELHVYATHGLFQ